MLSRLSNNQNSEIQGKSNVKQAAHKKSQFAVEVLEPVLPVSHVDKQIKSPKASANMKAQG